MAEKTTPALKPIGGLVRNGGTNRKVRQATSKEVFAPETTAEQTRSKRVKAVSVYLTEDEHRAFRRWAFDRELSMSDVLADKVSQIVSENEDV